MVVVKLLVLGALRRASARCTSTPPTTRRSRRTAGAASIRARRSSSSPTSASTRSRPPRKRRKNPQRNMPIGILGGLAICTVIYVIVGFVATGLVPYQQLEGRRSAGARAEVAGLTDGELDRGVRRRRVDDGRAARLPVRPAAHLLRDGARRAAAGVGRRRSTRSTARRTSRPSSRASSWRSASLVGDENEIYDLTNIGTLFAFAIVCVGVLVLRVQGARRPRPFRVPFVWPVALPGAAACIYMMVGLAAQPGSASASGWRSALLLYFVYGYRHSRLRTRQLLTAQAAKSGHDPDMLK